MNNQPRDALVRVAEASLICLFILSVSSCTPKHSENGPVSPTSGTASAEVIPPGFPPDGQLVDQTEFEINDGTSAESSWALSSPMGVIVCGFRSAGYSGGQSYPACQVFSHVATITGLTFDTYDCYQPANLPQPKRMPTVIGWNWYGILEPECVESPIFGTVGDTRALPFGSTIQRNGYTFTSLTDGIYIRQDDSGQWFWAGPNAIHVHAGDA